MNRLLGIVLDVEYLFTCVHREEDADTKQVYFYLFKVRFQPFKKAFLLSLSHCSEVLRFCIPGRGWEGFSAHGMFRPQSLWKHAFLHEGVSKVTCHVLNTSLSLRAFIFVCRFEYLYLLMLMDFFPSTHPFIHPDMYCTPGLCMALM